MVSHAKDDWRDDRGESHSSFHADEPAEGADDLGGDRATDPDAPHAGAGGVDDDLLVEEAMAYAEADAAALDQDYLGDGSLGSSGVATERDEYRDALLRVKADFDNYRKRVAKDQAATVERAAEKLVAELLPVLDACEAAIGHGATDVEPIHKSLLDTLEKGGLERMAPEGQPFDPNLHEAVMHEPGEGDEHIVLESLRTGYLWNGRVVRPAMVKVKG